MRILIIGVPNHIHTVRWISQLTDLGWDIHFVPLYKLPLHPDLMSKVTFHNFTQAKFRLKYWLVSTTVWLLRRWPHPRGSGHARRLVERLQLKTAPAPRTPMNCLAEIIQEIKPDIVHSLMIYSSGKSILEARSTLGDAFPVWMVSVWGSDLQFWARLSDYKKMTKDVLAKCNYLHTDCARDMALAREMGFTGHALPALSAAGGIDIERWQPFRQPGPTSNRRVILLKGYQSVAGRALAGLRALELCADVLDEYRIIIPMADPDVALAAERLSNRIGIPIETLPKVDYPDYEEVMRRYGQARIHIGLSIVDGAVQTMLETMVMGAFPIQSCTACADEWFEDGKGGLLVPPEDPHIIAEAIRRAITDDALVDQAAQINLETARQRLAYSVVKEQAIEMYKMVYAASKVKNNSTLYRTS